MYLVNPSNEYPRHVGDLLLDHPEWQEGDALPTGWKEVQPGTIPTIDPLTQIWYEIEPKTVSKKLTRQFAVRDLTPEELAAIEVPDPETPSARLDESGTI